MDVTRDPPPRLQSLDVFVGNGEDGALHMVATDGHHRMRRRPTLVAAFWQQSGLF